MRVRKIGWSGRVCVLAALAVAMALACTRRPDERAFDNPFDAGGSGTPFRIEARITGAVVLVSWRPPAVPGITRYEVLRSLSATAGFTGVGNVTDTRTQYVFQDTSYARNRTNYYKVRVYRGSEHSDDSQVAAAGVVAPPQVSILEDTLYVRSATVRVRTTGGDSVEIAAGSSFAASVFFPLTGTTLTTHFTVPAATAPGARRQAYARVWAGGAPGVTGADSAVVGFDWRVALRDTAVMDSVVVVRGRGPAVAMRAATSAAGLATAPWIPGTPGPGFPAVDDTIDVAVALPPGLQPSRVYSESRSDFDFTRIDSLAVVPRVVGASTIRLNGGAPVTSDPVITVTATAPYATEMRFSESVDFTGVPWQPFATTSQFQLSPTPGAKTVYAVFRNGLDPTGQAAVATIQLVGSAAQASR